MSSGSDRNIVQRRISPGMKGGQSDHVGGQSGRSEESWHEHEWKRLGRLAALPAQEQLPEAWVGQHARSNGDYQGRQPDPVPEGQPPSRPHACRQRSGRADRQVQERNRYAVPGGNLTLKITLREDSGSDNARGLHERELSRVAVSNQRANPNRLSVKKGKCGDRDHRARNEKPAWRNSAHTMSTPCTLPVRGIRPSSSGVRKPVSVLSLRTTAA
jgi:hypothetical protein